MTTPPFLAALGSAELLSLIADTTFFGKFILLVLLVISVLAWAVVIEKARLLAAIRAGHLRFWRECDGWLAGQQSRADLVRWCEEHTELPLCNQLVETVGLSDAPGIRRASERIAYLEIERLERYLIVLATAVTIAPFLGLLGTVWGIMTSFWDMAATESANLAVVAPGIAEALITTIAGLSTAIPAVIFYNMLVRKIDLVGNEMERLRTVLEEEAGGHGSENGYDRARRPDIHAKERI
jgi:biopolymer transport protein TolQ